MAFKVSNETKVGALTVITISLFIIGFNFLKGKDTFNRNAYLYARFASVDGLVPSNPVIMNGYPIGTVYKTEPGDDELNTILVTIQLGEALLIPVNSIASIKSNPLGTPSIEVSKGTSTTFLKANDTLQTISPEGFFGSIFDKLGPTQLALNKALITVDSLMGTVNQTLTKETQNDLQATIRGLSVVANNLAVTTQKVNELLADQKTSISNSLKNLEKFTVTLNQAGNNLPSITNKLDSIAGNINQLNLANTMDSVNRAIATLQNVLNNVNSPNNTLGALMNDRLLYDNISGSVNSLNLLLQDLRLNPKRYVNISVFGKKDNSEPLMRPLETDSITQEQYFKSKKD